MTTIDEGPLPAGLEKFYGVRVAQSDLKGAGLGLFAAKDFDRHEFIVPYVGTKMRYEEYSDNRHCSCYTVLHTKGYMIDARSSLAGLGRYANTADAVTWIKDQDRGPGKNNAQIAQWGEWAALYANKRIKKGEEILVSYGNDFSKVNCRTTEPVQPGWTAKEFKKQYSEWLGRWEDAKNKCTETAWKQLRRQAERASEGNEMPRDRALFMNEEDQNTDEESSDDKEPDED